jgi:fumarylacetoacetase
MVLIDETHDPALESWVGSANLPDTDFPIQNLPFGVFRRRGSDEPFRGGVAIGDQILDLAAAAKSGSLAGAAAVAAAACGEPALNALMALGPEAWSALRLALSRTLRLGAPEAEALSAYLASQSESEYAVPARIGDYTDFYTSIQHATNVGRLFRPDNPLLPNYKWVPIGYHGRTSTIGVSGQTFPRPIGQTMAPGVAPGVAPGGQTPVFGPSRRLDYELEIGVFIGVGNDGGERIAIQDAERHVFGLCLLNDWSARDIQAWEYQPLGPFLSKNFASTVSPWIVTLEALAPYRLPWTRPEGDPQPLAYLDSADTREVGAIDIQLEAALETSAMGRAGQPAARLSRTSFKHAYWTISQMVAHHTVNGCRLVPGDFLGSGTQSGPTPEEAGSLLELTAGGKQPVHLPNGEKRIFLEDGDTVILRAWCDKPGAARIGFGECRSTILPAVPL